MYTATAVCSKESLEEEYQPEAFFWESCLTETQEMPEFDQDCDRVLLEMRNILPGDAALCPTGSEG